MSTQQTVPNVVIGPYSSSQLFLIRAVSNLHPGVGRAGDVVDLAIQRDNLGYPIIYSSSLKGALKSTLWNKCLSGDQQGSNKCKDEVKELLGPEPEDGEKFTSKVAILDAILVAFPVRSLKGVYAYATSPLLLTRLRSYVDLAVGYKSNGTLSKTLDYFIKESKKLEEHECVTTKEALENLGIRSLGNILVINEEVVKCVVDEKSTTSSSTSETPKTADSEGGLEQVLKELAGILKVDANRLLVFSDDLAKFMLDRSIVRVTRVAIDREKKTVKRGALWTEEYVPMYTTFATIFLYSEALKAGGGGEQYSVKERMENYLRGTGYYLIIGGKETIGRGIVKLIPINGGVSGGSTQN